MNPDDFLMLYRWKTSLSFIFTPLSLSSFQVACWSSCLASLLPVASWWPLARRRRTRCGTRTSLEIPGEMCGKKHRKTIGKPQEKWREPLSVGNPRSHPHILMVLLSLYLSTYLNHPSLENHISSSQSLSDAIHFNRKRCGGQRPMPQSTCLDQSVYLLGRDILHVGPRIRSFVLVTWWFS